MGRHPPPNSATRPVDLAGLQYRSLDQHHFSHLSGLLVMVEEVKSLISGF